MKLGSRRTVRGLAAAGALMSVIPSGGPAGLASRVQSASGTYVVSETWRSLPNVRASDAWAQATGVDATPNGQVFVVDGDERMPRVTLWDPAAPARTLVDGAPLVQPMHVATDPTRNRLYVADIGADALHVFTMAGARVATHSGIPGALGVAVATDGRVYVTASGSGEVYRFTAAGTPLSKWSVVPPLASSGLLAGIDVDRWGRVHVLDGRVPVVHVLDGNGREQGKVDLGADSRAVDLAADVDAGSGGRAGYWLATPSGLRWRNADGGIFMTGTSGLTAVAVLPGDAVVCATQGFALGVSQLLHVDYKAALNNRTVVTRIGGMLTPRGVLNGPERIHVGGDGHVYLLDREQRVQRFDAGGAPLRQMRLPTVLAVDAGPDGTVFAVDGDGVRSRAFAAPDLDGEVRWDADLASGGQPPEAFVSDIALDPSDGALVVLDILDRSIRRFDQAGLAGAVTPLPPGPGGAAGWSDLAVDGRGRTFVMDRTGRYAVVIAGGAVVDQMPLRSPARRIEAGADGTLFALDRQGLVWHYDATGALAGVFDAHRPDLAAGSRPIDLAVDADGDILVADRNANAVTRFVWDPDARPMVPPPTDPTCEAQTDKSLAPDTVLIGQAVDVTLTVSGGCGSSIMAPTLDVYLVLDESGSMLEQRRMDLLRQAALDFIHEIDLSRSRVGLVTFSHVATLASSLTGEEGRLWRAVNQITPFGGTRIDLGLQTAREDWLTRRRPDAKAVFIVLSDGVSERGPAIAEADAAKAEGVEIFTISVGSDPQLMQDIATDPSRFFRADDPNLLFQVFDAIVQRITARMLFQSVDVVDRLAGNIDYVPGSAVPAAAFDPATRALRWTMRDVPFGSFELRYRVRPTQAGDWPVSVGAVAAYVDGLGIPGQMDFPNPLVKVLAPSPTPSPTHTPVPTPTPTPADLYFPLGLNERCDPEQRFTDAVLVVDASNSMAGEKFEAAKAAAATFVAALDFSPDARGRHDQVAVVVFNREARLAHRLSNDAAAIRAAIAGLQMAPGTMIDRGLQVAWDELRSGRRRAGSTPTVVLLTDGRHNDDLAAVAVLGDLICEGRIRLYTIGLGDDVDGDFLRSLACEPGMAYLAPGPDDLARIYTEIAGDIPCAPDAFWGGR